MKQIKFETIKDIGNLNEIGLTNIEINKNNLPFDLVSLIKDNVISVEDIKIFSEEIQEKVNFILNL